MLDILSKCEYIDFLSKEWASSGVQSGDALLLHSNIRRTISQARKAGVRLNANDVLDSFLRALGPKGTLILPLFNFDFPTSKTFDIRQTPSQMGALTELARCRGVGVRTGHPVYSFLAIGKMENSFLEVNNISAYGEDSPFAILRSLGGKVAVLDLEDQKSMTSYHYVEESHRVDYLYMKSFDGSYIDSGGKESIRSYTIYVRDIRKGVLTQVNPAGELLWKEGLYKGSKPHIGCGLRTIEMTDFYDFVSQIIESNRAEGTLFRYGN